VRAALGRVCGHVSTLAISAKDGMVLLNGHILEREHGRTVRAATRVRGVRAVEDRLSRHVHPDGVPGLQAGRAQAAETGAAALLCGDVMKRQVRWIAEDDTLQEAAEMMATTNVGFLPVCNSERRVVGTITDRDIVVRGLASGVSAETAPASAAMSKNVVACRPDDSLTLAETFMAQYQVSRLVIVDDHGVLAGVISLSDLAEREPPRRVGRMLRAVTARESPRS
jgi:CBS-domain-containing membrane protein